MPSLRSISTATRLRVQRSPRKPCASAPSRSHARTWLCCSAESRGRPPGALRRRSASGPPPSRARRIHWHTAPEVTPRAAAISLCRQPCSCSSHARKRRPSRQVVAVPDKEEIIHAASRGLDRVKTGGGDILLPFPPARHPSKPTSRALPLQQGLRNPRADQ